MNDRFKFRAWDIEEQKYREVIALGQDRSFLLSIGHVRNDTQIFEQCTGLKDKNGKLIYEGDIVEVGGRYAKGNYKIIFDECDCEYDLKSGNGWFVYQLDSEIADNSEVIGNIHENADLLGEDK